LVRDVAECIKEEVLKDFDNAWKREGKDGRNM
jgi:hypothetical protein